MLLQDNGKLLEFAYRDEDIDSLRRQMQPLLHVSSPLSDRSPSPGMRLLFNRGEFSFNDSIFIDSDPLKHLLSPNSSLSDVPPPTKRRRTDQSDSSLSEAEDDEDDEDRPLAARIPLTSGKGPKRVENGVGMGVRTMGQRAKKGSGKKGISHTTVPSEQPHTTEEAAKLNGASNGISAHGQKVKVEERLDDRQLSRLATGVTVDTGMSAPTPVSGTSFIIECN